MIQVIRSGRYLMRTRRVDNNEFAEICRLVGLQYSFHDQKMRWAQYFPFPMVASREIVGA